MTPSRCPSFRTVPPSLYVDSWEASESIRRGASSSRMSRFGPGLADDAKRPIVYPVQGLLMTASPLTVTEVAALTGVDEKRVRKEVEHGVFGPGSPPRFDLADLSTSCTLSRLGIELGVEDRAKLHGLIAEAWPLRTRPPTSQFGPVLEIKLAPFAEELRDDWPASRCGRERGSTIDQNILGGEPVFTKSRLAIRHVGGMLLRGAERGGPGGLPVPPGRGPRVRARLREGLSAYGSPA